MPVLTLSVCLALIDAQQTRQSEHFHSFKNKNIHFTWKESTETESLNRHQRQFLLLGLFFKFFLS